MPVKFHFDNKAAIQMKGGCGVTQCEYVNTKDQLGY